MKQISQLKEIIDDFESRLRPDAEIPDDLKKPFGLLEW